MLLCLLEKTPVSLQFPWDHFVAQGQRLKGQRDSRENTTRQVRGLENKSVESRTFKELLTES